MTGYRPKDAVDLDPAAVQLLMDQLGVDEQTARQMEAVHLGYGDIVTVRNGKVVPDVATPTRDVTEVATGRRGMVRQRERRFTQARGHRRQT